MQIKDVLLTVLKSYPVESKKTFRGSEFANTIVHVFPKVLESQINNYGDRYIIEGSAGKGKWADCPWLSVFDSIITTSAQDGYYLVYIFDKTMTGVYLSLNQGITTVRREYKHNAKDVLIARSEDFRCKLNCDVVGEKNIKLNGGKTSKFYENGNILAKYYSLVDMPNEEVLVKDLREFLRYYQDLVYADSSDIIYCNDDVDEIKYRRIHEKFDRRLTISLMVKKRKKYTCEACGFNFVNKYGELGANYIEAHHLMPFSSLNEGRTRLNLEKDFSVLCSNCHRMIHRLPDPSNLKMLKHIISESNQF